MSPQALLPERPSVDHFGKGTLDNMQCFLRSLSLLAILGAGLALSGCAFKKKTDPLEGINRGVYAINKTVDALYLKPIATAATKFLPKFVLGGIDNFFENIGHLPTIANDLLQCKFKEARVATARFIINSTLGVGGVFDFASSKAKLQKHTSDFGQTLAFYGYKQSIYIVWPLFGPSTIRDGIGRGVDMYLSVWPYIRPESFGWKLYGVYIVDVRAKHLQKEEVLKEAAVDEYILVRDAYLQNRRYQFGLEPDFLEDDEGEWSPLEDGVKDSDKDKDKDKKDAEKKSEETDTPLSKQDKELEDKMNMTNEELEAKQGKPATEPTFVDTIDIKGTSTLPPEKRTLKHDDSKNNR